MESKENNNFSEEIINIIKEIQTTFKEVYPKTIQEWINGFKQDSNPEREIAIWWHMSDIFKRIIVDYSKDKDHHKEIFKIILACSMGDDEYVLSQVEVNKLSKSDVKKIIKECRKKADNN